MKHPLNTPPYTRARQPARRLRTAFFSTFRSSSPIIIHQVRLRLHQQGAPPSRPHLHRRPSDSFTNVKRSSSDNGELTSNKRALSQHEQPLLPIRLYFRGPVCVLIQVPIHVAFFVCCRCLEHLAASSIRSHKRARVFVPCSIFVSRYIGYFLALWAVFVSQTSPFTNLTSLIFSVSLTFLGRILVNARPRDPHNG